MSAIAAIANDVPRRLSRGWVAWILLILIFIVVAIFAGGLGRTIEPNGPTYLTFFGNDTRPAPGSGMAMKTPEAALDEYMAGVFGVFFACWFGVFAGLVFLADAVTSAFAPGSAELNIPKPLHRWTILLSRHAGAILCAAFFATVLIGGGTLVAWARTGIFAWKSLLFIPGSVILFGFLHALGTIAGVATRNAFFSAFFACMAWSAGVMTEIPAWFKLDQSPVPIIARVAEVSKVVHLVLPRANDVHSFIARVIAHKPLDPIWEPDDIKLSANLLVWWVLALLLAILIVRRRDF